MRSRSDGREIRRLSVHNATAFYNVFYRALKGAVFAVNNTVFNTALPHLARRRETKRVVDFLFFYH